MPAPLLVLTKDTCILWYVSLESQHVIRFVEARHVCLNQKVYLRYAQICEEDYCEEPRSLIPVPTALGLADFGLWRLHLYNECLFKTFFNL